MVARTEKHRGVSSVQSVACRDVSGGRGVESVACRDVSGGRGVEVLVGTRRNELLTITLQDMASPAAADKAVPRVVALGHSGEGKLGGLAMHPAEDAFATFGDDGLLVEWALGRAGASGGRAVSYRGPDGADIALALHSGEVVVVHRRGGASGAGLEERVVVVRRREGASGAGASGAGLEEKRDSGATVARFDPTGTYLAVGFDDGTVELLLAPEDYQLRNLEPGIRNLKLATLDAVTLIDWATDGEILQTADASFEVYFWNLTLQVPGSGAGPDSAPEREWAAQSCPLAWTLQGMFVPGQEGEGIGAIAVDRKGKGPGFVLSAEASGAVRMYKFPCAQGAKPKVTAKGHASAVASVGMSCSRAFAVSVGGADLSALVWNIRGTGHLGI
ncbi:hypothetical protein T484DRAFT_1793419 [Baffinella frigidus]|nr:hypothetical protein T484DRAFT_1793419 [Cryptophyta sp. CCMP2293]